MPSSYRFVGPISFEFEFVIPFSAEFVVPNEIEFVIPKISIRYYMCPFVSRLNSAALRLLL